MTYIGVDPGKNGAIAALDHHGNVVNIARFSDAETEGRIAVIIADFVADLPGGPLYASVEKVSAVQGSGATGAFTFGRVYGEALAGLLLSPGVRMVTVSPKVWQHDLGMPKREDYSAHKRALKQAAEARFGRRFTLDECDAVLIAEHARTHGPWKKV